MGATELEVRGAKIQKESGSKWGGTQRRFGFADEDRHGRIPSLIVEGRTILAA